MTAAPHRQDRLELIRAELRRVERSVRLLKQMVAQAIDETNSQSEGGQRDNDRSTDKHS